MTQQPKRAAGLSNRLAAVLLLGFALGAVSPANAQSVRAPATPDTITPPVGNAAFLLGRAQGTQGYVCLPSGTGLFLDRERRASRSHAVSHLLRS